MTPVTAEGAAAVVRDVAAQTHVDHNGTVPSRPLQTGDDRAERAGAIVAEHLADHQIDTGRDSAVAVARTAPADGRSDMGAVADAVEGVLTRAEVLGLGDPALEVRVRGIDAGVEYGDGDTLAVESGLPGVGCTDLGNRLGEVHRDLAVEPDPVDLPRTQVGRAVVVGPKTPSSHSWATVASALMLLSARPPCVCAGIAGAALSWLSTMTGINLDMPYPLLINVSMLNKSRSMRPLLTPS